MTTLEAVLDALHARLGDLACFEGGTLIVTRNAPLPEDLAPDQAWLNLVDGETAEVEELLGAGWQWTHRADLELIVCAPAEPDHARLLDARFARIARNIADHLPWADETLGGLVDLCLPGKPIEVETDAIGEAVPVKRGVLPVTLMFETADAVG